MINNWAENILSLTNGIVLKLPMVMVGSLECKKTEWIRYGSEGFCCESRVLLLSISIEYCFW